MTEKRNQIPEFRTLKEEAEFWDRYDTTEFDDEFEPIETTFVPPLLQRCLTIPLDPEAQDRLRRLAEERETEATALARAWILDRLQAEAA